MRWNWMWWSSYPPGNAQAHSPLRADVFPPLLHPVEPAGKVCFCWALWMLSSGFCSVGGGGLGFPKPWEFYKCFRFVSSCSNSSNVHALASLQSHCQNVNAEDIIRKSQPHSTPTVLWLQARRIGPHQQRWRRSCMRCQLPTQSSSAVLQEATPSPSCAGLKTASLSAKRTAWEGIR